MRRFTETGLPGGATARRAKTIFRIAAWTSDALIPSFAATRRGYDHSPPCLSARSRSTMTSCGLSCGVLASTPRCYSRIANRASPMPCPGRHFIAGRSALAPEPGVRRGLVLLHVIHPDRLEEPPLVVGAKLHGHLDRHPPAFRMALNRVDRDPLRIVGIRAAEPADWFGGQGPLPYVRWCFTCPLGSMSHSSGRMAEISSWPCGAWPRGLRPVPATPSTSSAKRSRGGLPFEPTLSGVGIPREPPHLASLRRLSPWAESAR